ncbi:MAG: extracellular solute-binding protein [Rubrobacteraceae bacterium]
MKGGAFGRRKLSRKHFLQMGGASLAGAALLGTAGCGGGEGGENSIEWQAIPTYSTEQNTDQARVEYLEEAIASWEEDAEFTIEPLVSSSDITAANARLLEQASQERAPDIAMVDSYLFPRFYDFARPVDLGDLSLEDWFPFARDLMTGGGEPKGIQFTTDVRVMFYRTDLLDSPPASWDEVLEVGGGLGQDVDALLFPAGRDEATMTATILPLFWSSGGELTDEEGNPIFGEGQNRDAMLAVLGFIQECVENGLTPRRVTEYGLETDLDGDVASGNVAMFFGGNFQVGSLQEILGEEEFTSQWDVAPIPSESGDNFASTAGGQMWGLFTPEEAKRQAAADFLQAVFVGDEGMASWCNVGGYLPPRQSVFEVPAYEGDSYTDTFREHLNQYARSRPPAESYQEISTALQVAATQIVSGEAQPEQALQTAVESMG